MQKVIDKFDGEFSFLSNFHPSPMKIAGTVFPTAEHLFQAHKMPTDTQWKQIAALQTPGQAKRFARKFQLPEDWEHDKIRVMRFCVEKKFNTHKDLADLLIATDDAELIEGNTWGDRFWGVDHGVGENWLGKLLMQTRARLIEQSR